MIFDNEGMIADGLAHDGTTTPVDLGNAKAGPGNPIVVFVQGNGLAGATGFAITDGATSGAATDALASYTYTAAELNAGVQVELPSVVNQFIDIALAGTTSAGTWSAGVILGSGQTNQ